LFLEIHSNCYGENTLLPKTLDLDSEDEPDNLEFNQDMLEKFSIRVSTAQSKAVRRKPVNLKRLKPVVCKIEGEDILSTDDSKPGFFDEDEDVVATARTKRAKPIMEYDSDAEEEILPVYFNYELKPELPATHKDSKQENFKGDDDLYYCRKCDFVGLTPYKLRKHKAMEHPGKPKGMQIFSHY